MNGRPDLEPAILGIIAYPVRKHLLEEGRWDALIRTLAEDRPALAQSLDPLPKWVPASAWSALIDLWMREVGRERVVATGRDVIIDQLTTGRLAHLQRSWQRAFGKSLSHLARLVPHLWRASMRANGRIRVMDRTDGFVRLRLEGAPFVVGSPGWQALLEGGGVGLFAHAGVSAQVKLAPALLDPTSVDALFAWR